MGGGREDGVVVGDEKEERRKGKETNKFIRQTKNIHTLD